MKFVVIDAILGPKDGILAGVVDSLAASVEGSKKFPEDAYPFQAPGKTDQRGMLPFSRRLSSPKADFPRSSGPCPGLNTLANHGYLPRNGIVTAGQVIGATAQLFNMGADLAAVLVAGAVGLNGDIQTLTFSLGGADARESVIYVYLQLAGNTVSLLQAPTVSGSSAVRSAPRPVWMAMAVSTRATPAPLGMSFSRWSFTYTIAAS